VVAVSLKPQNPKTPQPYFFLEQKWRYNGARPIFFSHLNIKNNIWYTIYYCSVMQNMII
jgi:hypothetical protein